MQPPATRCTCSEGCGGWSLRTVAIVRTRLRTLDLAWSHAIPAELAYLLDDGSVHLLDAATAFAPEAAAVESPPVQAKVQPAVLIVHMLSCQHVLHISVK